MVSYHLPMSKPPVERLVFRGISSLRDTTLTLNSSISVLIGANGSGKSNLVRAIELLSKISEGKLQETVAQLGGYNRMLHKPPVDVAKPEKMMIGIKGPEDSEGLCNGYQANIIPDIDDNPLLEETWIFHDTTYEKPFKEHFPRAKESSLNQEQPTRRLGGFQSYIRGLLEGIRVYHFDDASIQSPIRRPAPVGDDLSLHSDAANLAPYLMKLRDQDSEAYASIQKSIRSVAPFFREFVLVPESNGNVRLRWKQVGSDEVFMPSEWSDGTLRFICLTTLLLSPDRPRLIVLDEPELGLHPAAIHQLGALIRQTVVGEPERQVILATQSTLMLEQFPLDSILLVDREQGATQVSQPNEQLLAGFLDEYSAGELWQMNLLGGARPSFKEAMR